MPFTCRFMDAGIIFCAFIFSTCPFSSSSSVCYAHIILPHTCTYTRVYERHKNKYKYIFHSWWMRKNTNRKKEISWKKASILLNSFFPSSFPLILLLTYVCLYAWAMSRWNINLAFLDFKPLLYTSIFYCFVCLNMP